MEITTQSPAASRDRSILCIFTVLLVLVLDQWLKIWVKTHMVYGEEIKMLGLNWARLHFVENEGMAFGISLGGNTGKLLLSLFRIVAIGFLVYILFRLIRSNEKKGLLICFSLILAGAIGNILDSAFFGLMFTESYYQGSLAEWAHGKGYAPFLFGRVVDMLYFPLIDVQKMPDWIPFMGGKPFQFFRPVFNISDTAISTGVIALIVFYRNFFKSADEKSIKKIETAEVELEQVKDALPGEFDTNVSDQTKS